MSLAAFSESKKRRSHPYRCLLNFDFHPLGRNAAINCLQSLNKTLISAAEAGFIMHVGGNQWYKNRIGVIKIFQNFAA
jgi:hypothetical protein